MFDLFILFLSLLTHDALYYYYFSLEKIDNSSSKGFVNNFDSFLYREERERES